jgi:hypothetical protein
LNSNGRKTDEYDEVVDEKLHSTAPQSKNQPTNKKKNKNPIKLHKSKKIHIIKKRSENVI